ncbi:unnamed protein product [Cylindrotheca closterium]|uniref:Uncharacterized protein n=1 Tax=Cylindrotheca closterium TaxID=2856 RepID=A0AAD2FNM9_9STRA|nr:unnamed protein product [Cylindrotheca closterium]
MTLYPLLDATPFYNSPDTLRPNMHNSDVSLHHLSPKRILTLLPAPHQQGSLVSIRTLFTENTNKIQAFNFEIMRVTILTLCTVATAAFTSTLYSRRDAKHHSSTTTTTSLQETIAPPNQNFGDPAQNNFGDPAQNGRMAPNNQQGGAMTTPPPQFRDSAPGGLWPVQDKWDPSNSVLVHGETLRTSSLPVEVNNIHMMLKSDGRPIVAKYELWMGPDYTPWILQAYSEDGITRPVNAMIATPKRENTIAIRNTANMEFPFEACLKIDNSLGEVRQALSDIGGGNTKIIQGGALRSYPLPEAVESVQILLKTDGRHLKAKVELLQGPNNVKQAFEVYASDGSYRPLHIVIDTPGGGNMVRIINKLTMEYPILSTVVPLAAKNKATGDITYL